MYIHVALCIVLLTLQTIASSNTEEYGEFTNPWNSLEIIREPGYEANSEEED